MPLKGSRHTLDFWVQEWNQYLEVKGIWRENALEKVNCAIKDSHDVLIISDVDAWMLAQSSERRISKEVMNGILA